MPAKSTAKATSVKEVTHVRAKIEKRHTTSTGKRLSPPAFEQYYTREEWKQFQESGPKLGYFLLEVIEAPDGLDVSYANPE